MITVKTAHVLIATIARVIAYIPTVTLAGYLEALIRKKLGDSIPERFGFLSFNIEKHFSYAGFLCLLFLGWGFGNYIDPLPLAVTHHITKSFTGIFFARAIAHGILLVGAFALLVSTGALLLTPHTISLMQSTTSFTDAFMSVVLAFFILNLMSTAVYFIFGLTRVIIFNYSESFYQYTRYADFIILILPFIFLLAFSNYIQVILLQLLVKITTFIQLLF